VVDDKGNYLVHPDRDREFGAQLGRPTKWQGDFPDLAASVGATESIARALTDQGGRLNGIALAPARLVGGQWIAVIQAVPNTVFMGPAAIQYSSLLVGLIAVLAAAALAILIARSLTRPIAQLTAAVESVAQKGTAIIPVDAGGETGVLARAFARVMDEANAKTVGLNARSRSTAAPKPRATIMPNGSGCSAPPSNPPTTPSSPNRWMALSPAGIRPRNGCLDTPPRRPWASTSR
jgi:HAMP domain-containing protein